MADYHGHAQEATDESVVSHEGLAELVSLSNKGSSERWSTSGGARQVDYRERSYESGQVDYFNRTRPGDFDIASRSEIPSTPRFVASPPTAATFWPSPSYRSYQSSQSRTIPPISRPHYLASNSSFDYPPPPPHDSFSPPLSGRYELESYRSPSLPTRSSFASLQSPPSRTDPFEENELQWVSSLDREADPFEGLGGDYQHGVGYAPDRPVGTASKGRMSEEKLARRIKKLQREFGESASVRGNSGTGEPLSMKAGMKAMKEERDRKKREEMERSGVDEKGRLAVTGAKKRSALRWFQGLGAIVVGVGSVGATLLNRSGEKPPPSGTVQLVALYIVPFVSLLITVYLFVLRPCLTARRIRSSRDPSHSFQQPGTVPLAQRPQPIESGWCSCFGGGGANDRHRVPRNGQQAYQPTSINLIVDPSMFGHPGASARTDRDREHRRRRREKRRKRRRAKETRSARHQRGRAEERRPDETDETDLFSSSSSISSLSTSDSEEEDLAHPSSSNPRSFSSILSHVNLEERWLVARKQVKWNAVMDCVVGVAWGGVGIWAIGFGEKCPAGGFEGYCNLYNTGLAFAILLSVSFFTSLTFDCLDLSRTKISPRHRQQRIAGAMDRSRVRSGGAIV